MPAPGIHAVQLILLLLLVFVVAFSTLALKLKTPYPIVLVVAGLLLGFVPGIPKVALDPEMVFLVVLRRCCTRRRGSHPGEISAKI